MNGSSLFGFIIGIIVLFAIGAIFFLTIDRVAKDPFLAKIAKIVIGCLILIALVLAVAGVLGFGGGGLAASPQSIVTFAVGVLVLIAVLYLIDLFLGWLGPNMGLAGGVVEAIRFIVTVVALIAMILIAGAALVGGGTGGGYFPFRGVERHGSLRGDADPASAGPLRELRGHAPESGAPDSA